MKSMRFRTFVVFFALLPAAIAIAETNDVQKAANEKVGQLARRAPRGSFPRGFSGEQVYWALVGVDGGSDSGLLSEDGALEIGKNGFSVEPVLIEEGKPVTWADVSIAHSLRDGYLPIPTTEWKHGDVALRVTAFGAGPPRRSQLVARYEVRNNGDRARDVTLALAIRPLQVDPPMQFLNAAGGVSPIHDLAWKGRELDVDARPRAFLLHKPDAVFADALEKDSVVQRLGSTSLPAARSVHDGAGFANGAALYRVHLRPHASETFGLVAPLSGPADLPPADMDTQGWLQRGEDAAAAQWHAKLDRVSLRLPSSAPPIAPALRSSLAWILVSRKGDELRPGTRSYDRSWIRDGSMMSDALLRLGETDAVRDYARWFAPFQFPDGKPPCCVDARGADPTIENDSPGELLHLIAQAWLYGHDRDSLQRMWPHAKATIDYMQRIRERGACDDAKTRMFCGLMPASISHEGYSSHPEHSYWDDFWVLTGYADAVTIAQALGKHDEAARFAQARDGFRKDIYASLRASIEAHGIDFVPGSAELGDFDPTSTTIALSPGGQLQALQQQLPRHAFRDGFERYWRESRARARGGQWKDYTPYEWRNVGVFARLGWRGRIPLLLEFFFDGMRPHAWNQWAEVVRRDQRAPGFIGDMPHAWVASDFIRSALDLFAYERNEDRSIVLAAGVQPRWLDDGGVALHGLRTPHGALGYTLQRDGARVICTIDKDTALPPGGLLLTWPLPQPPGRTTIDGKPTQWRHGELRIRGAPARIVIQTVDSLSTRPSH